jgi:hypothetical protein
MTTYAPSGRVMASVWLCAVVVAVGGMAGLLRITPEPSLSTARNVEWLQPPPFGVFIGTSLVHNALSAEQPANDIFRTAESDELFVRMATNSLSDAAILERVRHAVGAGVKKIFVEINPLLQTFSATPKHAAILRSVLNFSDRLRGAARQWLGRGPAATNADVLIDSPGDTIYDGNIREFALSYPVYIHAPRDPIAIAEALALARRQGLDIVWVAMPRSQTAAAYLGPAFETAFSRQLQAFAAAFNATVWRPALFWPNEFFVDQAHMNAAGRARFMSELRRYGATAR